MFNTNMTFPANTTKSIQAFHKVRIVASEARLCVRVDMLFLTIFAT